MTEPENSSIRRSKVEEQRMRQNLVMIEGPMKAGHVFISARDSNARASGGIMIVLGLEAC